METNPDHQHLVNYTWDSFIVQRGRPPAWFAYDPYKPLVWDNRGMSNAPLPVDNGWSPEEAVETRPAPQYKPLEDASCRRRCFNTN